MRRTSKCRYVACTIAIIVLTLTSVVGQGLAQELVARGRFIPGEVWPDTSGDSIQAHGGAVIFRDGTYYWYGEDRSSWQTSVSCYSSTDLYNWKHEGVVFAQDSLPEAIRSATFIERPKVIYNAQTGKYVLWAHLEQRGYHFAHAGIAISDTPAGPFTYVDHMRPVQYDFGYPEDDADRQAQFGGTYRDMNLFVDDDGKAYAFYASEGNWTLYIVRLNDAYTGPEMPMVKGQTWDRVLVREMREAPAPFKYQGRYYLVTSGCTGWTPNAADYAMADNILGPYEMQGNLCVGPEAELTFRTQSTCVLPVAGREDCFIYMGDRWNPRRLSDSRYIWLPFRIEGDGRFTIAWLDEWDLSSFDAL